MPVKESIRCYRTINGVMYRCYLSGASDNFMRLLRNNKVRYRKIGDDVFVHPEDEGVVQKLWDEQEEKS